MKTQIIEDIGDTVLCDYCNEDYTNSKEEGGLVFSSKGICPKCAPDALANIKRYNEERFIKAMCPDGMSFKDFIVAFRGDNTKIKFITLEDGDKLSDIFGGGDKHD